MYPVNDEHPISSDHPPIPWAKPIHDYAPTEYASPDAVGLVSPDPFIRPTSDDPFDLRGRPRQLVAVDLLAVMFTFVVCQLFGAAIVHGIYAPLAGVTVAPIAAAESSENSQITEEDRKLVLPEICIHLFSGAAAVGVLMLRGGQRLASIGYRFRKLHIDFPLGVVTVPGIYFVMFGAGFLLYLFWPSVLQQMEENGKTLRDLIPDLPLWGYLLMSIAVGTWEETIFRGILLTRFRRLLGGWTPAVVVSTLIFVALHAAVQVPLALAMIAFLSVTFSILTITRRSIIPAIVAHALFDFSQFCLMRFIPDGPTP